MSTNVIKRIIIRVEEIPVIVEWKRNKRSGMSLRLAPSLGAFKCSVPVRTEESAVRQFVDEHRDWIIGAMDREMQRMDEQRPLSPTEGALFVRRIQPIVESMERTMGLKASHVTVRFMTSCWGSMRPQTRRMTLNTRLHAFSDDHIRYVVIHELAHLLHPNHSPEFWALVERYCPDYKRLRNELKH